MKREDRQEFLKILHAHEQTLAICEACATTTRELATEVARGAFWRACTPTTSWRCPLTKSLFTWRQRGKQLRRPLTMNLAAQTDYGLPGGMLACHASRLDTSALTPGTYTLMMTVYAWETGERLLTENAADDGRALVGTVRVIR